MRRMRRGAPLIGLALLGLWSCASVPDHRGSAESTDEQRLARVHAILRDTPLIDGHNDIPWQYRQRAANNLDGLDLAADLTRLDNPTHTDIPRLRAGGVGGQFWSVYIPIRRPGGTDGDARIVFEQIDLVHRMVDRYSDTFEIARTADDVERIHKAGKIASMIGMEEIGRAHV